MPMENIRYLSLFIVSLCMALIVGYQDYEINSIAELFYLQNLPAITVFTFLIFGAYCLTQYLYTIRKKRIGSLVISTLIIGLSWFFWSWGSHAQTNIEQIRNFLLILAVFSCFVLIPILGINWIFPFQKNSQESI